MKVSGKREYLNCKIEILTNRLKVVQISFQRDKQRVLQKNRELKDQLQGKRCFILGNAPSLKTQDLSLLGNEFVFTVNQISRIQQFEALNTNIHFWADPGFFDESNIKGNNEFLEIVKSVNTKNNHPLCFFPLEAESFVKRHQLGEELRIQYFWPGYIFHENYKKDIDFCSMIPGFNTVVNYAIALAIYMGAKEIYLLGCDCTGILSFIETRTSEAASGYAYSISQVEAQRMKTMLGKVSCEQTFQGWANIFSQYRKLKHFCDQKGVKLINCTAGGILDCLPREKYEDVIVRKQVKEF